MKVQVKIPRTSVHHFTEELPDEQSKDVLQFDLQILSIPDLPMYNVRVDYPITIAKVKAAVQEKVVAVKAQLAVDETIRSTLENDLEFEVTV